MLLHLHEDGDIEPTLARVENIREQRDIVLRRHQQERRPGVDDDVDTKVMVGYAAKQDGEL